MENKTLNFINWVSSVLFTNLPILEFIVGLFWHYMYKKIKESNTWGNIQQ